MVNPLGPRIAKYTAAKAGHDVVLSMKQSLKLAVRFVQGSGRGMSGIYAKAQAKKDAREAVILARQKLDKEGIYRSADLDFLGSILKKVVELTPEGQREKLAEPDYRVALFDEAWKASIGDKKGIVHLKHREHASRDGTKALRANLRSKFAEDFSEFQTAKRVALLLSAVKKCETLNSDGNPDTIGLFQAFVDHFETLSGPALWSCQHVKNAYGFFGIPFSITELNRIAEKE